MPPYPNIFIYNFVDKVMKKAGVAIVVILVIIGIVVGMAYMGGSLKLPGSSTTANKFAPNVVSSSAVNKSLGGKWNRASSGYGTAGNLSSFMGDMSGPSMFPSGSNNYMYTPYSQIPAPSQSVYGNISSFQFSIFSPTKYHGFASVGIANYRNSADANATFTYVNSKIPDVFVNNTMKVYKGTLSSAPYIYMWTYHNSSHIDPSHQYISMLMGYKGSSIIVILYMTPINIPMSNFTALYGQQLSLLSSQSTPSVNSIFVSTNDLSTSIGGSWNSVFGINIEINNPQGIINEFSPSLKGQTSTVRMLINQTFGNLSQVAVMGYSSGHLNKTAISFVKFKNSNMPYTLFTDLLTMLSSDHNATVEQNVSGAMVIIVTGSHSSMEFHKMIYTQTVVAHFKSYFILIQYSGTSLVSTSGLNSLLTQQINLF